MLTLPAADETLKHHMVFSGINLVPELSRPLEQVGSAYEKLKVRIAKMRERYDEQMKKKAENPHHHVHVQEESSSSESEEEKGGPEEGKSEEWEKKRRRRTKEEIEKEALLMGDLYSILGIEHLTYEAGEGDIKSAYKKLALMYHPDKIGESYSDTDKEVWLKIQNAYETLVDPVKRKRYDSSLPFNDSIPGEADIIDISEEAFYDLFDSVFRRNALFAKKKPVPNIGDKTMPIDLVFKFYKYWDNFESWRDFS
jgi:DnaJ family protein C protein 2